MNNERRKMIKDLHSQIEQLQSAAAALKETADNIKDEIELVRDLEQEMYDNMPESLQGGDKGEAMQEAINNLDSAMSSLEDVFADTDTTLDDILSYLNDASA